MKTLCQKMIPIESANETRPSPSKRLYSQHTMSCDETSDSASGVQVARNAKIPRGTAFMFNAQTFLSELEARSEAAVVESKSRLGAQLGTIFGNAPDTKKKLLCQFDYYFVHKFREKFSQYKDWILNGGEFEVPAQFSTSRSGESRNHTAVEAPSINESDTSNDLNEKVAKLRSEACRVAKHLKELQASRNQTTASTERKKKEYLQLYAALSQHRIYSSALQSTAAFSEPQEGQGFHAPGPNSSNKSHVARSSSTSGLEPKQRLSQVLEVSEAIRRLKEAIKTRQLLGTQLEGLSPLFPFLEATPAPANTIFVGRDHESRHGLEAGSTEMVSGSRIAVSCNNSVKRDFGDSFGFGPQSPETAVERNTIMTLTQAESRALALDMFSELVERDKSGFAA